MMSGLTIMMMEHALHNDDNNIKINCGADEQCIMCCIASMLQQEEHYVCHGYLDDEIPIAAGATQQARGGDVIDETCRSKMCEWIFHVIDSTRLQRDTASAAMALLDRFLCTNSHRATQARLNRKEYQLAGEPLLYCILFFLNLIHNMEYHCSHCLHYPM